MDNVDPSEKAPPIIDPAFFDNQSEPQTEHHSSSRGVLVALHLSWEAWARCLFILMMLALVCLLTWRPSLGRFNLLISLVSPSRGDRLEWRAIDDPIPLSHPAKRIPALPEWRLSPTHSVYWNLSRPQAGSVVLSSGRITPKNWPRLTDNAWSWQNDAITLRKNSEDQTQVPPQKSMTAFRAGDLAAWPLSTVASSPSVSEPIAIANTGPDLPFFTAASLPALPNSPREASSSSLGEIPPLPSIGKSGQTASILPTAPGAEAQTPAASNSAQTSEVVTNDLPINNPTESNNASATQQEEIIDWKNREITGPIKDAYLIIYPKLQFMGLCVPGQGYIRKYNQIGVPRDLENVKQSGDDGRVPYGRYYIADRYQDTDGPRLFLSWPSPDDAKRIGLDEGQRARIEDAWKRQDLPPQNTPAGGGVGINGLRQWVDKTDGGFALEKPHMDEIFLALPDKAKVLIQP